MKIIWWFTSLNINDFKAIRFVLGSAVLSQCLCFLEIVLTEILTVNLLKFKYWIFQVLVCCVFFRVTFADIKYKDFMENKNIIKTFCGYKPSKKNTLNLMKVLLVLIKKRRDTGWTPKYAEYQMAKVNELWRKLFDQHKVGFKN